MHKNGPMQVYIILVGYGYQDSALASIEFLGSFEKAAGGLNTEQHAHRWPQRRLVNGPFHIR